MPRPCKLCPKCVQNCHRCPNKLKYRKAQKFAHIRINKQVSMSSSQAMYKKKAAMVSRQVGQGAWPQYLSQAGGPGDLQTARQQATINPDKPCKRNCSYRLPIFRTRTAYKGKLGVDRKHGSYARYLARRVGGELRKEKMPNIVGRTAIIKQPRNRTGTSACGNMCHIPHAAPSPPLFSVRTRNKCLERDISGCAIKCCDNRIPNGDLDANKKWCCRACNKFTGLYVKSGFGGPGQGVASGRCKCCS